MKDIKGGGGGRKEAIGAKSESGFVQIVSFVTSSTISTSAAQRVKIDLFFFLKKTCCKLKNAQAVMNCLLSSIQFGFTRPLMNLWPFHKDHIADASEMKQCIESASD